MPPSVSVLAGLLALGGVPAQIAAQALGQGFTRQTLNAEFYSEGIHAADVDRDGEIDVIAGPYWYKGPTFAVKTAFRTPRATPFPTSGDADCYAIFPHDFNADGWPDLLSFRIAGGAEAVWYQNPGSAGGAWTERVAFSAVHNESPAFVDVDGDGKPELVTNSARYGGWVAPDWGNVNAAWTFKSVTAQGPTTWSQFTHGAGAGDVNKDGRIDLLFPEGWWEQPAPSGTGAAMPWTHHPAPFWGKALTGEDYGGAQMHVYDVDGDGDNDVVTALQAHGWGLAWFEQVDTGFVRHLIVNTRADSAQYGTAFSQIHAVALADLDGDGLKDIVAGKRRGAHGNGLGTAELNAPAVLYWFELTRPANAPPRFEPRLLDTASGIGTQITIVDVNKDGRPDILTAARRGAFVFLNQMTPVSVQRERGRGPGFTPPFRNDFAPADRDAAGRKRFESECRECVTPY